MTPGEVVAECESCAASAWSAAWEAEADRLGEELAVLGECAALFQPLLSRGNVSPSVDKAARELAWAWLAVGELLVAAQTDAGMPEVTP